MRKPEGPMDCCKGLKALAGQVVCPKPRRAGPPASGSPSMAVPSAFRSREEEEEKAVSELLGLILQEDFQAERCANLSSSPPFFFGSPPCRTTNPIVKDAHFLSQNLNLYKPPTKESSAPMQAVIRIEGFDCPSTRAVSMA